MRFINNDLIYRKKDDLVAVYFSGRYYQINKPDKESFGIQLIKPGEWRKFGTLKQWYQDYFVEGRDSA
jgi:hypothetical protein